MLIVHPRLYKLAVGLSVAVMLLGLLGIREHVAWQGGLFLLAMVVTGIPHGATDHLVDASLQARAGTPFSWRRFLVRYLLTMLGYGLVWLFFPGLALLLFLAMSVYHFGQSQVLYVRWAAGDGRKRLLGLAWGLLVLGSLLLLHLGEVLELLGALMVVPWPQEVIAQTGRVMMIASAVAVAGLWVRALQTGAMLRAELLRELLALALLLGAFELGGLWLGFALYFGVWHSLSSVLAEIECLRAWQPYGWRQWIRDAVPFSVVSFAGIGLLLLAGWWLGDRLPLVLLFFIAISTLTLPHAWYMERLYGGSDRRG